MADARRKLIRQLMQETGASYQSVLNALREDDATGGKAVQRRAEGSTVVTTRRTQVRPSATRRSIGDHILVRTRACGTCVFANFAQPENAECHHPAADSCGVTTALQADSIHPKCPLRDGPTIIQLEP